MAKGQVFFSFHYSGDHWRASQVRNMGKVLENSIFSDNICEEAEVKEWIDNHIEMCSCLVLLIGEKTFGRKWINYEIKRALELDKGMVGIYIHKLTDSSGQQSSEGKNPFDYHMYNGKSLSNYIKCFNSKYSSSSCVYSDIEANISEIIEYGIENRPSTWQTI
ncbi:hypothetical protein ING2D1G_0340 [Peptoniphilus sp. ING2-D1G]|nr:hypothetical protein ING2D1G_0340 [Peptoniphilus sp. ING2-D1G]